MGYLALGRYATQKQEKTLLQELDRAVVELNAFGNEEEGAAKKGASKRGSKKKAAAAAGAENRQLRRAEAVLPAVLELVRDEGASFQDLGYTRDMTWDGAWLRGLQLVVPFHAKVGERVTLTLAQGDETMALRAQVRWSRWAEVGAGNFLIGLSILDVPEELDEVIAHKRK